MTADIRVRRCTLTVRRREGWSWGPEPRLHVETALARLEALFSRAVKEAGVAADVDVRLDTPVRLELGPDGVPTAASRAALVALLREHADAPAASAETPAAPAATERTAGRHEAAEEPSAPAATSGAALARTLARWSRSGHAARLMRAWPAPLVRRWIELLEAVARKPGPDTGTLGAEAVEAIAEAVLGEAPEVARASEPPDARLLVLLAALTAALGDRVPDQQTQALARRLAGDAGGVAEAREESAAPASPAPSPARGDTRPRSAEAARQVDIVPALPFLVLAQLARIGYADALVAAEEAAELTGMAAAIAGKTLPPPGRGWLRDPAEEAAIAWAAGLAREDVPAALAALAGGADRLLPPLRAAVLTAYAEGRSAKEEMLVTAGEHGIVCGEEAGLLPACWVADEAELAEALALLGDPPVRRTDAFAPLAEALAERRAVPRAPADGLERHAGVAVGTALGLIAADLWGAGGPLLALDRLAGLEARVTVTDTGLLVSVPRGQRWLDLRRGGLLSAFAVPWLHGGRLEVGTW